MLIFSFNQGENFCKAHLLATYSYSFGFDALFHSFALLSGKICRIAGVCIKTQRLKDYILKRYHKREALKLSLTL